MLIKSISMHNFRQYVDSSVEFATDPDRNITLVMGDNGTGKTTLAQAFLWCLYGETDFEISEVINRKVRDKLPPGGKAEASVSLLLNYNDIDYTIERKQSFTKVQTKVNSNNSELSIYYKKDGNLQYMNENERHILIKKMLPKQLSRFFFFDGERIRIMSDEINHGRSQEFKDAVMGLVGLNSIRNAIMHLKPSSANNTVIGYYKKHIDTAGNAQIEKYNAEILSLEKEKETLEKRLAEIEPQIQSYLKEEVETKAIIMTATPEMELKKKYEDLKKEIEGLEKRRKEKINEGLLSGLGVKMYDFITAAVVDKVIPELDQIKETNQEIPVGIEAQSLLYLLKRGRCICGEELTPGDPHFNAVNSLLDIVPPKTTGKYVSELRAKGKDIVRNQAGFFEPFKQQFIDLRSLEERISSSEEELTNLFNRLSDTSEGEKAKEKLADLERERQRLVNEQTTKRGRVESIDSDIHRKASDRDNLVNIDETNKRYIRYLAYAEYLYDSFSKRYAVLEQRTRFKLEKKINEIFPEIYDGGMRIEVDDKYNIKVLVDDNELSDDEVEKNTAQSYSVIFAFISSIIAMAKEKSLEDETSTEEEKALFREAEGYPLVMDAPLSNFDKTRIEQICTIIPSIAKQVVFFIKDTDGEVAEEHMKEKIGRKYLIETVKGSKTHSVLKEEA